MTSTLVTVDIDDVLTHPLNPRRAAVADDELVASIKATGILQALTAVPATDPGKYRLIAGHRRLDGARKAGLTTVPVVIRDDLVTEGQQVEAMLIENGRREDLTPVEEAEGYEQLELFGYKPKDIAKATGRSETTVRSRLKLRQLPTTVRSQIHDGQISVHDALALTEFADKPAVLAKLEAAAGTNNFAFELRKAKDDVARALADEDLRARIKRDGIPEAPLDGVNAYWRYDKGPCPIGWIQEVSGEAAHADAGCLSWTEYQGRPFLTCSNPATHRTKAPAPDPEDEKAREAERAEFERRQAEREERRQAESAAAAVRLNHAVTVLEQAKLPDVLVDMVQHLLPAYLVDQAGQYEISGQVAVSLGYSEAPRYGSDVTLTQMVTDAPGWTRKQVVRALAAMLITSAEYLIDGRIFADEGEEDHARSLALYLQWLADTDHTFCDVDTSLRDDVAAALTEDDDEQEAS